MTYLIGKLRLLNAQQKVFVAIAAIAIIAFCVLLFLIIQQQKEITGQTNAIQAERARSIRMSCEDQNRRHDSTIKTIDKLISKLPPDRRAAAKSSRASTILIINALAPKQNCNYLVKNLVSSE